MILTKNRLKKKRFKDDDEMLDYPKFSHLPSIREDEVLGIVDTENKATQLPDIMNNFSQTDKKEMVDKETDTYDDLNKVEAPFYLNMTSRNFKSKEPSRAEKMAQVWTTMVERNSPSSSSGSSGSEGFLERNVKRGFRLAEFAIDTSVSGANAMMALSDAINVMTIGEHQSPSEEEEEVALEAVEVPTSSVDAPQVVLREKQK